MFGEEEGVTIQEDIVLEKFMGDPIPENLFERVTIRDGKIVSVEKVKEVE